MINAVSQRIAAAFAGTTGLFARVALLRSLGHKPFALLWSGQTISRVGDWLYQVALAWWVLQETGSAAEMGAVLIFSFAPMLVFLLIGGVTVDRFDRVRLMLASDLLRGVVVGVVAMLAFTGSLQIWHVYIASLVFGFVDAFFQPAYNALVPQITPPAMLLSANSLTSISTQAGRVIGPAIGGAIVAIGGAPLAFGLNALTFFVSSAFLLPLLSVTWRHQPAAEAKEAQPSVAAEVPQLEEALEVRAEAEAEAVSEASSAAKVEELHDSFFSQLREGFAVVLSTPWLWVSILVFAVTNIFLAGPYSVAMPFLVSDYMHAGAGTLGLLYAIFPVGYILGGVWIGRKTRVRRRGLLTYGSLIAAGLTLLVFGLPVPVIILIAAALINGAGLEIGNQIWVNTMQEIVPGDKLGRVSSVDMMGSFALLPVGFALTGWAVDLLGPAPVFVLGGALAALFTALGLLHPQVRNFD